MKVKPFKDLSPNDIKQITRRSYGTNKRIIPKVKMIIDNVKSNRDTAILNKYRERFGKELYKTIRITKYDIQSAYKEVNKTVIKALNQMITNIRTVHKAQLTNTKDTLVVPETGISIWREWRAIEKVGLYIPGGKAIYPSSVLMSAIPAQIAGCKEIIMCSPPGKNGQIPSATVVAADMLGLCNIYKVGGAQAIAAMAYGTQSIPPVYKIFGAGNSYVTAAKMIVLADVAIDMPAGPSEIFIIADETANPAFIAADLLADGEHGHDSACVLLTTSDSLAKRTAIEIEKQLKILSTADRVRTSLKVYGLLAVVESLKEAIIFANEYAPEHLEIMTRNPSSLVKKITNAGSIFLGNWTSKSSGDYATGANHILPTGGTAKMYPPLGVDAFGKWMQVQRCTKKGLSYIRNSIEVMAEVEQLPAHKKSTEIRFKKQRDTTSGRSQS